MTKVDDATHYKCMMNSSFAFKWTRFWDNLLSPHWVHWRYNNDDDINDEGDNDDDDKIRREKFAFSAQLRSYNNGSYEELLTNLQLLQMCASQPILSFSIVTKTLSAVFVSHRFFGCVLHHQHHVNNLHFDRKTSHNKRKKKKTIFMLSKILTLVIIICKQKIVIFVKLSNRY